MFPNLSFPVIFQLYTMAPRKVTHPVTVPHSLCFINNNKPATAKVKFKRPWRYRGSKTKPKSSRNMFNSFWYPHVPEGPLVYHCFCRVSKFCRKCRALNCWCCVFRSLLDEVQNEVILRQRQVELQRGILEALKPVLQSPRYTRSTAKKHHRKFANSIRELQAHDLLDQEMFQEAEEIFEKLKQDRFALNKVQDFVLAFDTAPTLVELCLKSILHNPFMFPRYPGCFDRPSLLFSKNHNLLTDIKGKSHSF